MTRVEENEHTIEEVVRTTNNKSSGTYEEVVTLNLGLIAFLLGDISKSLAIIASESETEQARINMEKEYYHKLMMKLQAEPESEVKNEQ